MPNAVTYSRFYTDLRTETSVEAQQRLCLQKAEVMGLTVVAHTADLAISGAVPVDRREGGQALLANAHARRFDVLLMRGSRSLFDGLLRCGKCNGPMIAFDAARYEFDARKDRSLRCVAAWQ